MLLLQEGAQSVLVALVAARFGASHKGGRK
jgi:hypothetical protein